MTSPPELNESSLSCFGQGTEGDLVQCVTDSMFGAGGSAGLIGLMMGGVLITSLYIAGDGDPVVPTVATILVGSILVPLLPPQYTTLAYSVVVIGITAAGMTAARRYLLRGGF